VRDVLATRVGFGSGRTYEKAARVVHAIDEESGQNRRDEAEALRRVLNEKSVEAAAQVVKLPVERRLAVLRDLGERRGQDSQARARPGAPAPHRRRVAPSCLQARRHPRPLS